MLNLTTQRDIKPERGWWLKEPGSDRKAFGVVLNFIEGRWRVARILFGSPAEKAGVAPGEHLISVGKYEVGAGKGDIHELHLLMHAGAASSHLVTFDSAGGLIERSIKKFPLHRILEFDFDNGGSLLGACVGSMTCRPTT